MEISPISGVRIAPMIRSKDTDLGLTDVYEVERSSRTGDETYSPSLARAATGFEDDEESFENPEDGLDDDLETIPKGKTAKRQVNFLA
ncbi:MAG: hypothetical protein ABR907_03945 [Terracidiphilus sp.]|jgi:hypothetical protein